MVLGLILGDTDGETLGLIEALGLTDELTLGLTEGEIDGEIDALSPLAV